MKTKLLITSLLASSLIGGIAIARPGGEGGPRGERPDPEVIVATLIADHDVNGTDTLNAEELEQALVAMHEKMEERRAKREKEVRGNRPSPDKIATRLLGRFDADEDGALNSEELYQALEKMHRGQRGGKKGGQGKRGPAPIEDDQ